PSVADHPLRPATDHRLGRPLPHQLPNPTRAPPAAINLSPQLPPGACGISRSFPRLSPTTGQVPTRYSPVRHSSEAEAPDAFDLHALGMPPAFVLGQDQTLKFIPGPSTQYPKSPAYQADKPKFRASKRSHHARTSDDPPALAGQPPSAHPFPSLHTFNQHPPSNPRISRY